MSLSPKIKIWALASYSLLLVAGCAHPRPTAAVIPPPVYPAAMPIYHTVARGQTLYRIAKLYQVDVRELMRVNSITDARALETGQRLMIPHTGVVPKLPLPGVESVRRQIGPVHPMSDWRTITVHHSATRQGGAAAFHRDHLRRRMGGLFYHFVIGNGTNTGNGEIEAGWRWKRQVKANRPYDIQVCLVGDFSKDEVSEAQFQATVSLISVLQEQYHIHDSAVRKHEDIKGKHTECPGKYFPFAKLLRKLENR